MNSQTSSSSEKAGLLKVKSMAGLLKSVGSFMDSDWSVNLKLFLTLRVIVFIGSMSALLFLLIMGAPGSVLLFFAVLTVCWYAGSFLIEAFIVAVGRTLRLRCGLFAMVDIYLLLSIFSHAGGAMSPVISAFVGYVLLAAFSCGLFVGLVSAAAGLTAFVYGYVINPDIGPASLIAVAAAAAFALFFAFIARKHLPRLLSLLPGRLEAELNSTKQELLAARREAGELQAIMDEMQKNLEKITRERDEALLFTDRLKEQAGGDSAPDRPDAEPEAQAADPEKQAEPRAPEEGESKPEEAGPESPEPEAPQAVEKEAQQ